MEKMLLSVPDAAKVLGIGKNRMYELVNAGHIKVLRIGGAKVPRYELERFTKDFIQMDLSDANHVKRMEGRLGM